MSQKMIDLIISSRVFPYQCGNQLVDQIDITLQTILPGQDLAEIDPWAADGLDSLFAIPIHIKYVGRKNGEFLTYHKVKKSKLFAYYQREEINNRPVIGPLTNFDDICRRGKRNLELLALRLLEGAEWENSFYDLKLNLFTHLYPRKQKEKILQITPRAIESLSSLPPAHDYASIVANQQHSRPFL